jgi:hypothetical protein
MLLCAVMPPMQKCIAYIATYSQRRLMLHLQIKHVYSDFRTDADTLSNEMVERYRPPYHSESVKHGDLLGFHRLPIVAFDATYSEDRAEGIRVSDPTSAPTSADDCDSSVLSSFSSDGGCDVHLDHRLPSHMLEQDNSESAHALLH